MSDDEEPLEETLGAYLDLEEDDSNDYPDIGERLKIAAFAALSYIGLNAFMFILLDNILSPLTEVDRFRLSMFFVVASALFMIGFIFYYDLSREVSP